MGAYTYISKKTSHLAVEPKMYICFNNNRSAGCFFVIYGGNVIRPASFAVIYLDLTFETVLRNDFYCLNGPIFSCGIHCISALLILIFIRRAKRPAIR